MSYLTIIRNIRNTLFKVFLINILFVIVFWVFAMLDLMQYFIWALPGWTLEMTNDYIIWLIGLIEVVNLVLFLAPTLALSWEIGRVKPKKKK
ncbi:MAG: hypothetical protein FWF97_00900 [Alphaproteobacteria bacterium]|nr:hypothetical protein [Alphaproteobacteria bacterium]